MLYLRNFYPISHRLTQPRSPLRTPKVLSIISLLNSYSSTIPMKQITSFPAISPLVNN